VAQSRIVTVTGAPPREPDLRVYEHPTGPQPESFWSDSLHGAGGIRGLPGG